MYILLVFQVGSGCVPVRLVEVSSDEPGYVYIHVLGHGTKKLEELINDVNDHYKNKVQVYLHVLCMYIG